MTASISHNNLITAVMCPTDFSFGAPPRVSRRSPVNSSFGFKILLSERPPRAPRCCHQRTMLYRMKMFKSQKPSSVDLRASPTSRGFPASTMCCLRRRTSTRTTRCALTSERRGPSTRQTACKSTRFPRDRRTSRRRVCQHAENVSERHVRLVCPAIRPRLGHVASRRRDSEQAAERAPVRHVGSGGSAERVLLNLT